jgi:Tol biopolymer transport system component
MLGRRNSIAISVAAAALSAVALFVTGCSDDKSTDSDTKSVPHEGQWGIYALDLSSQGVTLLYSTGDEISGLNLGNSGTHLAFSRKTQSSIDIDSTSEIYSLSITDGVATRLTDNYYFDSYPSFSPDDSRIAFLSMRNNTLDLFVMDSTGENQQLLYNSGEHDADVDWGHAGRIAFTRGYQIWTVKSDGTDPQQVTNPPNAGLWGVANLPIGDYDPRISPDGHKIAFERMVDVSFPHGGYDIRVVSSDGSGDTSLTNSGSQGYAQGFPSWSHSGDRLVYILSAVGEEGRFDLCLMNSDGSENRVITPAYFPATFLCHNAVFSADDSKIYFIGQWWQSK